MYQFLATLIRGREHCHVRSTKCPAPGTFGMLLEYMEKYEQVQHDNAQLRSMLMEMEGAPLDSDDGDDEEYREGS